MIHLVTLMQAHYRSVVQAVLAMLLARAAHYQQVYDEVHKAPH